MTARCVGQWLGVNNIATSEPAHAASMLVSHTRPTVSAIICQAVIPSELWAAVLHGACTEMATVKPGGSLPLSASNFEAGGQDAVEYGQRLFVCAVGDGTGWCWYAMRTSSAWAVRFLSTQETPRSWSPGAMGPGSGGLTSAEGLASRAVDAAAGPAAVAGASLEICFASGLQSGTLR